MKYALFALLLAACSAKPVKEPAPEPVEVVDQKPVPEPARPLPKAEWPNPEWTALLVDAFEEHGGQLLQAYVPEACGDRVQFWTNLVVALSKFESNWNPSATYTEDFRDNQGNLIISRGLLQVSQESCNGYGAKIRHAQELHEPVHNLRCAVMILNKWVPKDGVIWGGGSGNWLGIARYFSPFRVKAKRDAILAKARASCQ